MYIKSLYATGVYGFLNFNIEFNKDLSFLTGYNGSGKTTAIKLLSALLTPSARDLNLIPFDKFSVAIDHNNKLYVINAKSKPTTIEISIPKLGIESASIPLIPKDELEYRFESKEGGDDFFNSIILQNQNNKVIKFLLSIPNPIFLGLERKILTSDHFTQNMNRRRFIGSALRSSNIQKIIRSNLGYGLLEVQQLVQESLAEIRRSIDKANELQKNELIKNSFTYTKFSEVFETDFSKLEQEKKLLEKRNEIENALDSMGMLDPDLKDKLNDFFTKVVQIQEKVNKGKNKEGLDIEWLINKAQISRINNFINIVDNSKETIDLVYAPIREFTSLINSYFKESNKTIEVDAIGQIFIKRPNEQVAGIEALSSGEKQIIIIFANSILRKREGTIYIIDEPELSLHLGWQERLINDIIRINSDSQYIFATHSPEIIAGFENKCIGITK